MTTATPADVALRDIAAESDDPPPEPDPPENPIVLCLLTAGDTCSQSEDYAQQTVIRESSCAARSESVHSQPIQPAAVKLATIRHSPATRKA